MAGHDLVCRGTDAMTPVSSGCDALWIARVLTVILRAWTSVTHGLTCKSLLAYHRAVADEIYLALADGTRRVILDELMARDGQSLFEICSRLAMRHGLGSSRQAITQHLDVLAAAGLVRIERQGRYRLHHIDTRPLAAIARRWPHSG